MITLVRLMGISSLLALFTSLPISLLNGHYVKILNISTYSRVVYLPKIGFSYGSSKMEFFPWSTMKLSPFPRFFTYFPVQQGSRCVRMLETHPLVRTYPIFTAPWPRSWQVHTHGIPQTLASLYTRRKNNTAMFIWSGCKKRV